MATFGQIITKLREDSLQKRQETADALGISRASLEYYEKDKRKPDIEVLTKIADYYHVSADYLLGRTNAKTTDKDVQFVCEYTGLSDESVAVLHADTFSHKDEIYPRFSTAIDFLLQGGALYEFSALRDRFFDYRSYWQIMNERTESMNDFLNGNTEKSVETYAEMSSMFYSIQNIEDRRDVQKLRMQEILSDLLECYCIEEKYREEELQDGYVNFTGSMLKLETYLSKQQKDGEPHGNDQ